MVYEFLEQIKNNIKEAIEDIAAFFLVSIFVSIFYLSVVYDIYFPMAVSIIKDIPYIMKRAFTMKKFWRLALVVMAVSVAIYQGITTRRHYDQLETVLEATTEQEALKTALKMGLKMRTPSEVWLEFFLGATIAPVGIIMMVMEWNFRSKIHKTIMLGWICSAIGNTVAVMTLMVMDKTYNAEVEEI